MTSAIRVKERRVEGEMSCFAGRRATHQLPTRAGARTRERCENRERNKSPRKAHLVLSAVNSLSALFPKPDLFAVEPRLLLDRLADPDVPVQADDQVDSDRRRVERMKVGFRADDQRGRDRHQEAVLELRGRSDRGGFPKTV